MNTLSRSITTRFFPTNDSYNVLQKHWSSLMNSERKHELRAYHHLLYLVISGKDWRRAFTLPSNRRKLENGAFQGWAMFRALQLVRSKFKEEELLAPFDGLITPPMLTELRKLLPLCNPYSHRLEDFANGQFPFDAYLAETNSNAIIPFKGNQNA